MRPFTALLSLSIKSLLFIAMLTSWPARAADPDALWHIVTEQCIPNSVHSGNPAPCAMVDQKHGFVLLKDRVGVAQYLLIPIARLSGIESRELLRDHAPNYWRYAWEQRERIGAALGSSLSPEQIGVEVNSAAARSQLQLHLHMDCVRADLPGLLQVHQQDPLGRWMVLMLDGHRYSIMRLPADALQTDDPFRLAAARSPYAASAMAAQSLLLTGARFDDGRVGFYLINMPVNFDQDEAGSAEVLLDHDCAIAR